MNQSETIKNGCCCNVILFARNWKQKCSQFINYLTVKSKCEQHEEEEHRPELWHREVGDHLGVRDESQSAAGTGHILHLFTQSVRHEAKNGKDDKTSEETGEAVANSHNQRVSEKQEQENFFLNFDQDTSSTLTEKIFCAENQVTVSIPVNIVVEFVVGGHGDEAPCASAQWVEYLHGSVRPHLQVGY